MKNTDNDILENIGIHLHKALALARELDEPMLEYVIGMGVEEIGLRLKKKEPA